MQQVSWFKSCPPQAVPLATYFGPQGREGVCPFNPIPLEVFTTKVNIIRTNAPSHRWGFKPRPPRLAHQNYSIYSTNSLAESGPKLVSELKPNLVAASVVTAELAEELLAEGKLSWLPVGSGMGLILNIICIKVNCVDKKSCLVLYVSDDSVNLKDMVHIS